MAEYDQDEHANTLVKLIAKLYPRLELECTVKDKKRASRAVVLGGHEDSGDAINVQLTDGNIKSLAAWVMDDCLGEPEPPDDEDDSDREARMRRERKMIKKHTRVVSYGGQKVEPPVPLRDWLQEVHERWGVAQLQEGTTLLVYWYDQGPEQRAEQAAKDEEARGRGVKPGRGSIWWPVSYSTASAYRDWGIWYLARVQRYNPASRTLTVKYEADDNESDLLLPLNFVHFGSKPPEMGGRAQVLPPPWRPPTAGPPAQGAAAGPSSAVAAGTEATRLAAGGGGSASAAKADKKAAAVARGSAAQACTGAGGASAPPKVVPAKAAGKAAPVKRPAADLFDDFEEALEDVPINKRPRPASHTAAEAAAAGPSTSAPQAQLAAARDPVPKEPPASAAVAKGGAAKDAGAAKVKPLPQPEQQRPVQAPLPPQPQPQQQQQPVKASKPAIASTAAAPAQTTATAAAAAGPAPLQRQPSANAKKDPGSTAVPLVRTGSSSAVASGATAQVKPLKAAKPPTPSGAAPTAATGPGPSGRKDSAPAKPESGAEPAAGPPNKKQRSSGAEASGPSPHTAAGNDSAHRGAGASQAKSAASGSGAKPAKAAEADTKKPTISVPAYGETAADTCDTAAAAGGAAVKTERAVEMAQLPPKAPRSGDPGPARAVKEEGAATARKDKPGAQPSPLPAPRPLPGVAKSGGNAEPLATDDTVALAQPAQAPLTAHAPAPAAAAGPLAAAVAAPAEALVPLRPYGPTDRVAWPGTGLTSAEQIAEWMSRPAAYPLACPRCHHHVMVLEAKAAGAAAAAAAAEAVGDAGGLAGAPPSDTTAGEGAGAGARAGVGEGRRSAEAPPSSEGEASVGSTIADSEEGEDDVQGGHGGGGTSDQERAVDHAAAAAGPSDTRRAPPATTVPRGQRTSAPPAGARPSAAKAGAGAVKGARSVGGRPRGLEATASALTDNAHELDNVVEAMTLQPSPATAVDEATAAAAAAAAAAHNAGAPAQAGGAGATGLEAEYLFEDDAPEFAAGFDKGAYRVVMPSSKHAAQMAAAGQRWAAAYADKGAAGVGGSDAGVVRAGDA